ncbi:restriction endonuclease subunit S [Leptolyngbya sp. FACHB-17]|uniref:restriction endonuclease subunit S n=1 Tax=unclassified Leptolyngbya TaxID=2650499 RepID=UPI00168119A0|nr:restriction endonuclease subunit S [Leptolyngbya sp. FACHB-17]MBD2079880.1 restriction endonuclease subunit S [Leptolyngbya sp. FACHB-17]
MLENLPDRWDVVKAGKLAAPGKHSCVGGPFGSNLVRQDYVEYPGVPVIRGGNLVLGSRVFQDFDFVFVSEEKAASLQQNTAHPGDLVFMQRGASIGQVSLIPKNAKFSRYILSQNLMKLTPDPQKADVKFLCYYFLSPLAQELIQRHSVGSTIPGFNLTQLRDFPVPLPPLNEQKAIAHILGTLDDKIELNRQMNQTLEEIARALFKSWFIDFDPVRAKMDGRQPAGMDAETAALFPNEFEDSAIGKIPKGWVVGTVQDIGHVICGKTPSTQDAENYGADIPFITIPDMHGKIFSIKTNKYLSSKGAKTQANKTLPPYSICVSCIATPGLVVMTTHPSQTNQQINSVIPYEADTAFYYYFVLREVADEIKARGSGGSVFANLNKGHFSVLPVLLAPAELRARYHLMVEPIFAKFLSNELESFSLTKVRDELLPKLLSGGIRIKDAKKVVEAVT